MKIDKSAICVSCQECCKWMTFTLNAVYQFKEIKEYYEAHGCRVIVNKKIGQGRVSIMVPHVCPNLTEKGCAIYQRRPQFCRDYDGRDDPFLQDVCKLPKRARR